MLEEDLREMQMTKAKFSHHSHPRKEKKILINESSLSINTKSDSEKKKYLERHKEATNLMRLSAEARSEVLEMRSNI